MEENTEIIKRDSFKTYSRWIVTITFTLSICYKIITSDLSIDLSDFNFTDLLSLILAIFAIWISINFYHNNNITSNKFYDNTYNFTKDISETLGRIEERFGEKLESLKDENKSISTRIDKYYSGIPTNDEEQKAEAEKLRNIQAELQKKNDELNLTIQELSDKYDITTDDKSKFIQELQSKNEEIKDLKRKVSLFDITNSDNTSIKANSEFPNKLISYGSRVLKRGNLVQLYHSLDDADKRYFFKYIDGKIAEGYLRDLEKYDIVDSNNILTPKGERFIKFII